MRDHRSAEQASTQQPDLTLRPPARLKIDGGNREPQIPAMLICNGLGILVLALPIARFFVAISIGIRLFG